MSESVFAAGFKFEGRVTGDSVRVLGAFSGELVLEGDLAIGEAACVGGTVTARSVTIAGGFEGEIRAQRIAFGGSAQARGRFFAPVLRLDEGATVEGAFNLEAQDGAEIAPTDAVEMEVAHAAGTPTPELPDGAGPPPKVAVPERPNAAAPESPERRDPPRPTA
jgi:cytoskeletal protein CcmA (bactofilin family)